MKLVARDRIDLPDLLPLLARGLVNDHSGRGPAGDVPGLGPRVPDGSTSFEGVRGAADVDTIENEDVEELPRKRGEFTFGDKNAAAPDDDDSLGRGTGSSCLCPCPCPCL